MAPLVVSAQAKNKLSSWLAHQPTALSRTGSASSDNESLQASLACEASIWSRPSWAEVTEGQGQAALSQDALVLVSVATLRHIGVYAGTLVQVRFLLPPETYCLIKRHGDCRSAAAEGSSMAFGLQRQAEQLLVLKHQKLVLQLWLCMLTLSMRAATPLQHQLSMAWQVRATGSNTAGQIARIHAWSPSAATQLAGGKCMVSPLLAHNLGLQPSLHAFTPSGG